MTVLVEREHGAELVGCYSRIIDDLPADCLQGLIKLNFSYQRIPIIPHFQRFVSADRDKDVLLGEI